MVIITGRFLQCHLHFSLSFFFSSPAREDKLPSIPLYQYQIVKFGVLFGFFFFYWLKATELMPLNSHMVKGARHSVK